MMIPERAKAYFEGLEQREQKSLSIAERLLLERWNSCKFVGAMEFELAVLPTHEETFVELIAILREQGVPSVAITAKDCRVVEFLYLLQEQGCKSVITRIEHKPMADEIELVPAVRFYL